MSVRLIPLISVGTQTVIHHWGEQGGLTALCGKSAGTTAYAGDQRKVRRTHESCAACARRIREGDLS